MGTWEMIAAERAALVDKLAELPEDRWEQASLCSGWTVRDVAGHITASAYQTQLSFFVGLVGAGFSFDRFVDKGAHKQTQGRSTKEVVDALRARIDARNHPPGPSLAMLGEVVIHGEDIFRAIGMPGVDHPTEHVVAVADFYKRSNLIVGAKRRIAGLTLRANDTDWSNGSGPEASGPVLSLVLAMTGRTAALDELAGDGIATLRARY
ncbi:MAG TPA: maleylpyruvate isomerase family mycothiol-dependent enzyme [Acidimicrobiales bacterium]|nr:maleylpyruvate isomerase family mycothiol-dependent enzyme [Acidimicrobiales bacterium]